MLRIGIIGFGFMGRMHAGHWSSLPGAQLVAVCDSNPRLRQQAADAIGNIAGAGGLETLDRVHLYQDLEAMLANETLDAVSVTVPTHLHEAVTCRCLAAGLHVLCEKPIALTVAQGQQMIAAAEKAGRLLQVGQCIRFWPEYAYVKDRLASGRYGRVLTANFHRLTAMPDWSHDGWLADAGRSGGFALDLHIHDTDFVHYAFGLPRSVTSFAAAGAAGAPVHLTTRYGFDDGSLVTAEAGWGVTASFGFFMGFELMCEQATFTYDCRRDPTLTVCPAQGEPFTPELPDGDGYAHEIAHFASALAGEAVPVVIQPQDALESIRIVEAELESLRRGERVALQGFEPSDK